MIARRELLGAAVGLTGLVKAADASGANAGAAARANVTLSDFLSKPVELEALAAELAIDFEPHERQLAIEFVRGSLGAFEDISRLSVPAPPPIARRSSWRPSPSENVLGAWQWRTSVRTRSTGLLAGKTVALKDNITLAGVPMEVGSAVLEGYIPQEDATVASRVLEAGGEIVGKATCEDLCFSFGSHTAVSGAVRNPADPTRVAGGSSSGCAALVATGAVDMAIGSDQGGSIRVPAAFCGIVGLKPTWGLVPYTGAVPIEFSLDHLGPMARSVIDCARLLDVIAGPDNVDPRQRDSRPEHSYLATLGHGARGIRVAVLEEGFGLDGAQRDVEAVIETSLARLTQAGMVVSRRSVPAHRTYAGLNAAVALLGSQWGLGLSAPFVGSGGFGRYLTTLHDRWRIGLRRQPRPTQPLNLRLAQLLAAAAINRGGARLYAHAHNLAAILRLAYDGALRDTDVLVMPTVSRRPPRIPDASASPLEHLDAAGFLVNPVNTAQFNNSGHPAISLPCGHVSGLPVGIMMVARRGEDSLLLRVAHAFEQA